MRNKKTKLFSKIYTLYFLSIFGFGFAIMGMCFWRNTSLYWLFTLVCYLMGVFNALVFIFKEKLKEEIK